MGRREKITRKTKEKILKSFGMERIHTDDPRYIWIKRVGEKSSNAQPYTPKEFAEYIKEKIAEYKRGESG